MFNVGDRVTFYNTSSDYHGSEGRIVDVRNTTAYVLFYGGRLRGHYELYFRDLRKKEIISHMPKWF